MKQSFLHDSGDVGSTFGPNLCDVIYEWSLRRNSVHNADNVFFLSNFESIKLSLICQLNLKSDKLNAQFLIS